MSKNLNRVELIGHLGADPELKYTQNGKAVATISLATNNRYRDEQGNLVETPEWHRIVLWDKLAETAQEYLHRGSLIFVEGRLHYRQYEVEGQKRVATEVVARDFIMLDNRASNAPPKNGAAQAADSYEPDGYDLDEEFAY